MQNRVPVARKARGALPEFDPVPRVYRHDGWTPERQKAFIEALADTGSVSRAAAMVNMAQANCYTLRRAKGAEGFRRAWEAALDFGVQRLKDVAFERAMEGQLVPVFVAGKLMGYRRKRNDALLMFCLRHYGQDANGKRTTINYFSTRASAGAGVGAGGAAGGDAGAVAGAQASTTTMRTVVTGGGDARGKAERDDEAAALINGFDGVALDAQAQADIHAVLLACAERRRAADALMDVDHAEAQLVSLDDPGQSFVPIGEKDHPFHGELEPEVAFTERLSFTPGEADWRSAGARVPDMYLPYVEGSGMKTDVVGDGDAGIAEVKKRPPRRRKG